MVYQGDDVNSSVCVKVQDLTLQSTVLIPSETSGLLQYISYSAKKERKALLHQGTKARLLSIKRRSQPALIYILLGVVAVTFMIFSTEDPVAFLVKLSSEDSALGGGTDCCAVPSMMTATTW